MFEDITHRNSGHERGKRATDQLLSKYIELKQFEKIHQNASKIHKRKLQNPQIRRRVLEMIHNDLIRVDKPEETYEVWHNLNNLNQNIRSRSEKSKKTRNKSEKEDNISLNSKILRRLDRIDEFDDEEVDDKYEHLDNMISHKLDQFTSDLDNTNRRAKIEFVIRSKGLEVLPKDYIDNDKSFQRQQINNLTTLLHLNILRKKWDLAYKVFSLVIRFPNVDIRTIWPLGIEILSQLQQGQKMPTLKVEKFFDYLSSFYMITNVNSTQSKGNSRTNAAPVWRSGSKTMTPLYVITALWNLFIKQDYETLINRINELVLEPPYNTEGVLYFIHALCHLCQAIQVVYAYTVQDTLKDFSELNQPYRNRRELIKEVNDYQRIIEDSLKKCEQFEFQYPKQDITEQISSLLDSVNTRDQEKPTQKLDEWDEISSDEDVFMDESEINGNVDSVVEILKSSQDEWDAISSDEEEVNGNDWEGIQSDTEEEKASANELKDVQSDSEEVNGNIDDWRDIESDSEEEPTEHQNSKKSPGMSSANGWSDINSDLSDSEPNHKATIISDIESEETSHKLNGDETTIDDEWSQIRSDSEEPPQVQTNADEKPGWSDISSDSESEPEPDPKEDGDSLSQNTHRFIKDMEDDDIADKYDSFYMRRNSLELYSNRSASVEPETLRKEKASQNSQSTMIDFDFDFDFD